MTPEELDFVKGCLSINPDNRLTAKELLAHSYLNTQNSEILRKYKETVIKEEEPAE